LSPFLVGLGFGAGILGLTTLLGFTTGPTTILLAVLAIVMAALLGLASRCMTVCEKD